MQCLWRLLTAQSRAVDPDPDPGGTNFQIKTEKCKEIAKNGKCIQFFKGKFAQSSIVSYFLSIFYVFYNYKKTLHSFIFYKLC